MDELTANLNTPEAPAPDAPPGDTPRGEDLPREVVLRYAAPSPREVVLRYVSPAPEQASPESGGKSAEAPEVPSVPVDAAPPRVSERRASRKGLRIFLVCLGILLLAATALGVLYWRGVLPHRGGSSLPANYPPEFDWYANPDSRVETETTLERYPNGDNVRLRYAETHGSALNIQEVYARVNPCTVTIATALPGGGAIIGTGVIFTPDGYILTNAHVITGGERCYVVLDNGRSYDNAKLVGCDEEKDLAVIKIDAKLLPTAEFGDSDALTVGDTVYAIGNPLGVELRGTLTDGIVSAINRDVNVDGVKMTLIQTNAALNNGNSGGPLINIYGQVIGINTMKMGSSSTVSVEGLGFAIPISSAAWMVNDLITYGEIHGEPVLGISVLREAVTLPTGETALQIEEIIAGGAAEKAGVELGDLIVRADGESVGSVNDLLRARRRYGVGEALSLEIERNGQRLTVDIILEEAES